MKKTSMFLGMFSILAIVSCKKKVETPLPIETSIEVNTPAPVVEEKADGTSISIKNDAVDVSTKNGSNETNVIVGGGDASVEVKK
jgi:ferric-dicitrate binding protein FerR (iron transport regulator)